jgi:hypothetical protein
MHIWLDRRPDTGHRKAGAARTGRKRAGILPLLLALGTGLTGCASPGPPLPPSLNLPEAVAANEFTATRVGDTVAVHWTTPTRTTDKLLIAGPITAVVCRSTPSAAPAAAPARPIPTKTVPCSPVIREAVSAGPSDAIDTLPAELTAGPPRLIAYRVELLNAKGHGAGPSAPVFALAGVGEPPLVDFRAEATKPGVLLRWRQQAGSGEAVELTRTTVAATPAAATSGRKPPTGLPGEAKEPAEARFQAGPADAGGTIDRTVQIGHTYTYIAQRVLKVQVGAQTLELRSAPSAAVAVPVRDVFPPEAPAGLVAVPAFVGEGQVQKPAIDLSWEPDVEPRVTGYRVYRREGDTGAWQRLGTDLVPVPAYRDAAVVAGHIYTYRVTAVGDANNESAASAEVTETAPAQ